MARSHGLILFWNFVVSCQTEAERQSVPILSDRAGYNVQIAVDAEHHLIVA
jgi:hypothetical protein